MDSLRDEARPRMSSFLLFSLIQNYLHSLRDNFSADGLEAGKDRFLTEREDEAIQCRVQGYRSAHGNALNLKC